MSAFLSISVDLAPPYLLVMATPGPNMLLILRASLEPSSHPSVATALGIGLGACLAALLAVAGVSMLSDPGQMESTARLLVAAFLARAGWSTFRVTAQRRDDVGDEAGARAAGHFRLALFTAAANPLTLPFFMAFFLGRIPPGDIPAALSACVTVFVLAGGWFLLLGRMLRLRRIRAFYARAEHGMNGVIGVSLLSYAVLIALPLFGF